MSEPNSTSTLDLDDNIIAEFANLIPGFENMNNAERRAAMEEYITNRTTNIAEARLQIRDNNDAIDEIDDQIRETENRQPQAKSARRDDDGRDSQGQTEQSSSAETESSVPTTPVTNASSTDVWNQPTQQEQETPNQS